MKQIQSSLYGENLIRFLNIQETIQRTRRAISEGGTTVSHLHEDIVHFSGHRKHIDGAGSLPSISGDTGYSVSVLLAGFLIFFKLFEYFQIFKHWSLFSRQESALFL